MRTKVTHLIDVADGATSQPLGVKVSDVVTVQGDVTRCDVIETHDQRRYGRLACEEEQV